MKGSIQQKAASKDQFFRILDDLDFEGQFPTSRPINNQTTWQSILITSFIKVLFAQMGSGKQNNHIKKPDQANRLIWRSNFNRFTINKGNFQPIVWENRVRPP